MKRLWAGVCRARGWEQFGSPKQAEAGAFLDLPDAPDFISEPPAISLADNIRLCEEMLETWNRRRFADGAEMPMATEAFYL